MKPRLFLKPMFLALCFACGVLVICSCGKKAEDKKPRTETFLSVDAPVTMSDLTLPGLVKNSRGELLATLFIHSGFPSATEAVDAIEVLKSEDDGATWTTIARIPSPLTYGVWGYDLTIGKDDALFLTWVASLREADSPVPFKAVLFSRSDDNGVTWTAPTRVSAAITGQRRVPVIAVSGDAAYVAWLDEASRVAGSNSEVMCASSADGGTTWGESVSLETALNLKASSSGAPSLCVGQDGTVYCAYISLRRGSRGGFWLAKSVDGGRSFQAVPHGRGAFGDVDLIMVDGKLCLAAVHVIDIKSLSRQDPRTSQEIHFYTSDDGGDTWSDAVLIDDDPNDEHKSNIRLAPLGDGRLLACWHDERGGLYLAASLDGGQTWGKNLRAANASTVGITPFEVVTDPATGRFRLLFSDVRQGGGDATFFLRGHVAP